MSQVPFWRRVFGSFAGRMAVAHRAEAERIAASPGDVPTEGFTPSGVTNTEVTTLSGALPAINKVVTDQLTRLDRLEQRFVAGRDEAQRARRQAAELGTQTVRVREQNRELLVEESSAVAGDGVTRDHADVESVRLRDAVQRATQAGSPAHLVRSVRAARRAGTWMLFVDTLGVFTVLIRALNLGAVDAFGRDPVSQTSRLVTAVGVSCAVALFMFVAARVTAGLTWTLRNSRAEDTGRRDRSALMFAAVAAWATVLCVGPVLGIAVAVRVLHDADSAGLGAIGGWLGVGVGLVMGLAPALVAFSDAFAPSVQVKRLAGLSVITADTSRRRAALADQAQLADQRASAAHVAAIALVERTERVTRHLLLGAEQVIFAGRGQAGHAGEVAAVLDLPEAAGDGQLVPDVSRRLMLAPMRAVLVRMAARSAGPARADTGTTPAPTAAPAAAAGSVDREGSTPDLPGQGLPVRGDRNGAAGRAADTATGGDPRGGGPGIEGAAAHLESAA